MSRVPGRGLGAGADRLCYQSASTLITSQIPVALWHEVIGEPTFADAILDRIVHNAHRLELAGPSMRKVKAKANLATAIDHSDGK